MLTLILDILVTRETMKNAQIRAQIRHVRIQLGDSPYYANSRLLRTKLISHNAKIKIYKIFIWPVVAYKDEKWTLEEKNKKQRRIERKIVRRVCVRVCVTVSWDDEWIIKNNHGVDELLKHEYNERFIKAQRMQWLGHLERMGDERMWKKFWGKRCIKAQRGIDRR